MFRRSVLTAALLLVGAGTALACLWDDDTLRMESEGLPDVMKVIAGSFERNPPLYYEMRLRRMEARLVEDASDLAAFDNAAVACDRLGRGDEAVAYMERKKAALDRMAAATDGRGAEGPGTVDLAGHRYRYLANAGTFWAHRWLRNGADRAKIAELEKAADLIREAIQLNPDAHFGRERYQLKAMEWLIAGEPYVRGESEAPKPLGDFLDLTSTNALHNAQDRGDLAKLGYPDAVTGITGMIVLGAAWESVDMFHALALALQVDGRSSVSYLASKRVEELVAAGKGSLRPGAPKGAELFASMQRWYLLRDEVQVDLDATYVKVRKSTEEWHARRTEFMLERLKAGRHPDTDPEFWKGFGR